MELEFFATTLEETKADMEKLRQSGATMNYSNGPKQANGETVDINEHNNLKIKWRKLQIREAELLEEIERLQQQYANENKMRGIKNVLERSKSRGRGDG